MVNLYIIYIYNKENDNAYKNFIDSKWSYRELICCTLKKGHIFNQFLEDTKLGFQVSIYIMNDVDSNMQLLDEFYTKITYDDSYTYSPHKRRELVYLSDCKLYTSLGDFNNGKELIKWLEETENNNVNKKKVIVDEYSE